MLKKEIRFIEHPEDFLLDCCVCKEKFLPESFKQYINLVKKHKKYNRGFYCSDKCKAIHRGSMNIQCDTCGKNITINKNNLKNSKHHYCSRECYKNSPFRKK